MARKKEFDTEFALDQAMQLFWLHGYERTSLDALLKAMKIGRASFYNAYGNKHNLFMQVLTRYLKQVNDDFILATLDEAESPIAGIIDILEQEAASLAQDMACKGCLMVNAEVELMMVDDEAATLIKAGNTAVQERFKQALQDAVEKVEIAPDHDIDALAEHLMNNLRGMKVLGRYSNDQEQFDRIVTITISALNPIKEGMKR